MRKRFNFNHNENGLILPPVLFLTTFVLLYFTNNLLAYNHDIIITRNIMEQVKAQTIFQMSYTQYMKQYHPDLKSTIHYLYPDGKADIQLIETQEIPLLSFNIQTSRDFHYSVTKSLISPSDLHNSDNIEHSKKDNESD